MNNLGANYRQWFRVNHRNWDKQPFFTIAVVSLGWLAIATCSFASGWADRSQQTQETATSRRADQSSRTPKHKQSDTESNRSRKPYHSAVSSPTDPFVHLPDAISIPETDWHGLPKRYPIGPIPTPVVNRLKIAINSEAVAVEGLKFSVGTCQLEKSLGQWPIYMVRQAANATIAKQANDRSICIGRIVASAGRLGIELAPSAAKPDARQLCNCLLILSTRNAMHTIQLRPPVSARIFELDLSRAVSTIEFTQLTPLPRRDCCTAELEFDSSTSKSLLAPPARSTLKPGDTMAIEIAAWPGAEIRVRMLVAEDEIRLQVAPLFAVHSRKYPLTPEAITKLLARHSKQQTRNRRDLELARKRLAKIPRDLRKVSRVKARTPAQRGFRSMNMALLEREAAKLQARIHRLRGTIPKLENHIENLQRLLRIARQLDRHMCISARIVARTASRDIELAVTR